MRYIVKVECLSAEVLAELEKSSRIIHIFSLIDNTIALETEDIGHIKGLKEVRQVYESGKAKLMLTDALNKIGIFDVQNQNVYGDGVWIGVIDSRIVFEDLPVDDPKVRGSDIGRAAEVLGWETVVGAGEGLRETVEYFEKLYGGMS